MNELPPSIEQRLAVVEAALQQLGVDVQSSLNSVRSAPAMTCINNGVVIEAVLRDLWKRLEIKGPPSKRQLEDLLTATSRKLEEEDRPIPRRIHDYIRAIQLSRNRAAHHMDASSEDASESLRQLAEVAFWYFAEFLKSINEQDIRACVGPAINGEPGLGSQSVDSAGPLPGSRESAGIADPPIEAVRSSSTLQREGPRHGSWRGWFSRSRLLASAAAFAILSLALFAFAYSITRVVSSLTVVLIPGQKEHVDMHLFGLGEEHMLPDYQLTARLQGGDVLELATKLNSSAEKPLTWTVPELLPRDALLSLELADADKFATDILEKIQVRPEQEVYVAGVYKFQINTTHAIGHVLRSPAGVLSGITLCAAIVLLALALRRAAEIAPAQAGLARR